MSTIAHETLRFVRELDARPERVYAAFADVEARASWSAPSETAAVVYSAHDFVVQGEDRYRCGSKDELPFTVIVRYLEILAARRIVYSETVAREGTTLAAAQVSWDFAPGASGTSLVVTAQVASFVGTPMIDGTREGTSAALDHLAGWLAARA